MKKITLMLIVAFAVLTANATRTVGQSKMLSLQDGVTPVPMTNVKKAPEGLAQKMLLGKAHAPRKADADAASVAGDYIWNYATYSGAFSTQPDTLDTTAGTALVKITAAEEKADSVIITGMGLGTLGGNIMSANGRTYLTISSDQTFSTSYGDAAFYGVFYYEGDDNNQAGWYYDTITGIVGEDGTITFPLHWMRTVLVSGNYAGYALGQTYVMGSTLTPDTYVPNTTLVTLPEGAEVTEMPMTGKYYANLNAYSSDVATELATTVKVAKVDNEIFVQGILVDFPEAWVKGTITEDEVEVPVTYVGATNDGNAYICGYSQTGIAPVYFMYNKELGALELDGYIMLTPDERELNISSVFGIYEAIYIGEHPETVEVPENLETESMPVEGTVYDGQSQSEYSATVTVGVDGQDVYIKGLVDQVPEGWIKGTFNEDRTEVVFPYGQYVGAGEYGSVYVVGEEIITNEETGEEDGVVGNIIFTYDASKNLYELQNNLYVNGKKDDFYYYSVLLAGLMIGENCDEIWEAEKQGYENAQDLTEIKIAETVTGTLDKGTNSNGPKYYTSGKALRMYPTNTLTITSEKLMGKIVITMTGLSKQMSLEANVGSYELNGKVGTWTGEANEVVFSVPNVSGYQARIQSIKIYYFDYSTTLVTAPEDLEVEPYAFKGLDTYRNEETTKNVQVGFDGDYVYFQGLSDYVADAWVRGTMTTDGDGNKTVEIPGWYMGTYVSYFGNMEIVFSGATFAYDEATSTFSSEEGYQTTADGRYTMDEVANVTITKIVEMAATPANPSVKTFNGTSDYPNVRFNIPTEDVDGNPLVTEKLSYAIWFEKDGQQQLLTLTTDLYSRLTEDMTEIPYDFTEDYDIYAGGTVYLNQDLEELQSWTKIGVQSIYRGAGEEHKSEIGWFNLDEYWVAVGITDVKAGQGAAVVFDLQGRRVAQPTKGLYIVNGKKVVVK